ncbi:N-acetyltransferase [Salinicoccus sp. ID82-1]|uniref:GNAT family N-acetyltransferase n=1 Tax=Salinicoccus sp. ID82-1 TaxID=2820269 RepID=UPI001F3AA839|nr:GNAT family N-acetyltransferase [Salinicoccus sp. ID82-1]MCG1008968.1 N-acetyltransferase [Salinicoccus sp. ID82-1]
MDIKKGENMFFVGEDELNPEAKIVFTADEDQDYVIQETQVNDELGGQGVGTDLVETMAEFARQEDKRIVPQCPFARDVMEKDDSMKQLIK